MHAAVDRTVEYTPVEAKSEPAKKVIGTVKKNWVAVVAEKIEEKEEREVARFARLQDKKGE